MKNSAFVNGLIGAGFIFENGIEETDFMRSNKDGVNIEDFMAAFPGATITNDQQGEMRDGTPRIFRTIETELGTVQVALHSNPDSCSAFYVVK